MGLTAAVVLAQTGGSTVALMLLMLAASGYMIMRANRRMSHRADLDLHPARAASRSESQATLGAAAPAEAQKWEVQMHETARELQARLDSKIGVLHELIRIAEQQSHRLEAAIERAQGAGIVETRPRDIAAPEAVAPRCATQSTQGAFARPPA